MKKIGIIGGAGPLASALLYEMIIHESYQRGISIPEIVLINFPFTRGLSVDEGRENKDLLSEELNYCLKFLIKNEVEIGLLACNTLHLTLKNLPQDPIQFYYVPDLVLQAASECQHHRLLILGTENTCHSHLYRQRDILTLYPSPEDQHLLNDVINRVLRGKVVKEDSDAVGHVIQKIGRGDDFDGVVLGCTDFPVLHHRFPIPSVKPIYDSIKLSAQTIVGTL